MKKINIEETKNIILKKSFLVKSFDYGREAILINDILDFLNKKKSEPEECCENCEKWIESCIELSEKFGVCFTDENKLGEYIYYDEITDKLLFRRNYHCNHWQKKA